MKRIARIFFVVAVVAIFSQASSWDGPPPPAATRTPSPDLAKPFALFQALAGTWDVESEMSPRPNDPMTKTSATETIEQIGAYALAGSYEGTIMGSPLRARYLLGYNSAKKVYTSAWLDNMSGLTLTCEGTFDAEGRVLTMRGGYDDPKHPERANSIRQTIEMPDDDTRLMSMYVANAAGEERVFYHNKYTRRKSDGAARE